MNVSLGIISGMMYPPRNKIAVNADIRTILQYSARKKNTKRFIDHDYEMDYIFTPSSVVEVMCGSCSL